MSPLCQAPDPHSHSVSKGLLCPFTDGETETQSQAMIPLLMGPAASKPYQRSQPAQGSRPDFRFRRFQTVPSPTSLT